MTTPALIAYTVSAVALAIAIGMVALPYLLGSPDRRFSGPLAGKSEGGRCPPPDWGHEGPVAGVSDDALCRYCGKGFDPLYHECDEMFAARPHTWPGSALPSDIGIPISPSDAALSGLARREAMRDPASYEGPDHDPGQPWRPE